MSNAFSRLHIGHISRLSVIGLYQKRVQDTCWILCMLTLNTTLSWADNICKQFGLRRYQALYRHYEGFHEKCIKNLNFEKDQQTAKTSKIAQNAKG